MGRNIEITTNPAFRIGDRVKVNGIVGVCTTGQVVGFVLETELNYLGLSHHVATSWQYHIILDDDIHLYSLETQLDTQL